MSLRTSIATAALCTILPAVFLPTCRAADFRRLPVSEYRDKMTAGWIGQMAGVGWGAPTEFKYKGRIIPENDVPQWRPELINQFHQDDLYVEMTFLRTLEEYGLDCSIRQAGIDFANTEYPLWCANRAGRDNLRRGIAPPDSGHPDFSNRCDDIDYQIEADYSGLIAPGMPNLAVELGDKFGRLMNYGDGVYAGQFVGGMYAEAFFETDILKIVQAGLACIPAESHYAQAIADVINWHERYPEDWRETWERVDRKYHRNPDWRKFTSGSGYGVGSFNIDAKLNGAYVVIGLLYGERDPDKTIKIAMRCGQDSDCNPSTAGGILFTTIGASQLPERFTSKLNRDGVFSHTEYSFTEMIDVCERLARMAVERQGGRIEGTDGGPEFVIPIREPRPGELEQSWDPQPSTGARFTDAEMDRIEILSEAKARAKRLQPQLDTFAPGWQIANCGPDMNPGLREEYRGRKNVFVTHPLTQGTGCILSKEARVPPDGHTTLNLMVGHDTRGDWRLIVRADGERILAKDVSERTATNGWLELSVDLSSFAGKSVLLELVNQPTGWSWEAGYWGEIAIRTNAD